MTAAPSRCARATSSRCAFTPSSRAIGGCTKSSFVWRRPHETTGGELARPVPHRGDAPVGGYGDEWNRSTGGQAVVAAQLDVVGVPAPVAGDPHLRGRGRRQGGRLRAGVRGAASP